jgi:hypothetical protein
MYDATYWYNTKTLSGSYILTGSLTTNDGINVISITASNINAPNITGSLFGTSSWSNNAVSSSYAPTNNNLTASYAILTSVSMSLNFVDDEAAAAGGVPLGGLYRNGNFILIRLT